MDQLLVSPFFLAAIFFFVALAYASVGLGGGSSYTALLTVFGASQIAIPSISLTLNLIVTTAGSYQFIRNDHARWRLIIPFFVGSIPFAYIGGSLELSKAMFQWLLFMSLTFVFLRIYCWQNVALRLQLNDRNKLILSVTAGSVLGFIAGTVGIGGGIFLVPLILILGLGTAKEAAAVGAIFIWFNSCSGLIARYNANVLDISFLLPLAVAALAGGALGAWLGSTQLAPRTMEKILGMIVGVALTMLGQRLILV